MEDIGARLGRLDWAALGARIDEGGWASLPPLLARGEADRLIALYDEERAFRSTVTMARHGFGRGEYRYFRYPLPDIVQDLRALLYGRLLVVANRWRAAAGQPPLPETHADYLALCRDSGQARPTPLLLRYGPGDHNNLHQDLYGDLCFPLQAVFLLSAPGDFEGGELVLTEQRPRMQSRVHAVPLEPLGGGGVRLCAAAGPGGAGTLSCRHAPRGEHGPPGLEAQPRDHLPRCFLARRPWRGSAMDLPGFRRRNRESRSAPKPPFRSSVNLCSRGFGLCLRASI